MARQGCVIIQSNTPLHSPVTQRRIGTEVVSSSGVVDRRALGTIVFSHPDQRRWLEQLVHPIVRQRFDQELMRLDTKPAVMLMIPLLFESGLEALCTEIWLVDCDEDQQLQRLQSKPASINNL